MKVQDFKDLIKGFNKFSGDKKGKENMTTVHCPLCSVYWSRLVLVILGLSILILATGMSGGCSVFPRSTSTTYYYPNWMPDGRIIATREKLVQERGFGEMYPVEDKFHVVAITIDENNDVVKEEELFEVTHDRYLTVIAEEITCSPTGEMIGFIGGEGLYVTDYSGNVLYRISFEVSSKIPKYFDWSPDATRIAYANWSRELHVVNIDGTNDRQIASSVEVVAWRVGEKIVYSFADTESSKIYSINVDGSSKEVIAHIGVNPQISNLNKIVYNGGSPFEVRRKNIDGTGDEILFYGYDRSTLKLSFDNTKIVGGDLITGGGSLIGGIWVTNVSNGNSKKIR